ncbi:MAG TPA: shikimate dehydrogenase, partial [Rhodospirillaceae bacterium]|nr:shikimate dehydrogenase [Rhodospirillaceae bacterium]
APEIRLVNRNQDRAQQLADQIGGPVRVVSWDERAIALAGAGLLVNTTSLGMTGHLELELDLTDLPGDALVNDIVYAPLHTDLLVRAAKRGNPVVDGLGMLLHQARPGFAAWFGPMPEVTPALRKFVEEA